MLKVVFYIKYPIMTTNMFCKDFDQARLGALRDAVDLSNARPEELKKAIRKCLGEGCQVYAWATAIGGKIYESGLETTAPCAQYIKSRKRS